MAGGGVGPGQARPQRGRGAGCTGAGRKPRIPEGLLPAAPEPSRHRVGPLRHARLLPLESKGPRAAALRTDGNAARAPWDWRRDAERGAGTARPRRGEAAATKGRRVGQEGPALSAPGRRGRRRAARRATRVLPARAPRRGSSARPGRRRRAAWRRTCRALSCPLIPAAFLPFACPWERTTDAVLPAQEETR